MSAAPLAAPVAAPTPNLFGLSEYDNLSSFFGDQSFDYNGFVLPPVRPTQEGSAVGVPVWWVDDIASPFCV